jgi:hypothetical protein
MSLQVNAKSGLSMRVSVRHNGSIKSVLSWTGGQSVAGLQKLSGNSPAIQLVLPQPYIERLNALAQQRRVTRSALIREAIDVALLNRDVAEPVTETGKR